VWATDASRDAVSVARANLVGLGRAAARVAICEGDWFSALPPDLVGNVQLVVSNPPYVRDHESLPPEVADWEPAEALRSGADGLDDIRRILAGAPRWLEPQGVLVCELSPEQAEPVMLLAGDAFRSCRVEDDLARRPRMLVAREPIP
jgi:release factor glutamine methyltransferase